MRARGTDKMLCKAHHATGRDRGFRLDRIPLLIETYRLAGFFRRARIVRNLWVRQRPWVVHRHSHGHLKNESDCNKTASEDASQLANPQSLASEAFGVEQLPYVADDLQPVRTVRGPS
jgi:hypothetical protein